MKKKKKADRLAPIQPRRRPRAPITPVPPMRLVLPVDQWSLVPVPGLQGQYHGHCFVPVLALKGKGLEQWLQVNPRRPLRSRQSGRLRGPMINKIVTSLTRTPVRFVNLNRGITISAHSAKHSDGQLTLDLRDPALHGLVDGATTAMTIIEAIERVEGNELEGDLSGYVSLRVLIGVPLEHIPDIAESLNRSVQVDQTSLNTKRGFYDSLKEAMQGQPGSEHIRYFKGDSGSTYVNRVVGLLELLNLERYNMKDHPQRLVKKLALAESNYSQDLNADPSLIPAYLEILPQILRLSNLISLRLGSAWDHHAADGKCKWKRYLTQSEVGVVPAPSGKKKKKPPADDPETLLPFLWPVDKRLSGVTLNSEGVARVELPVPMGLLFPLHAAFRSNLQFSDGKCRWQVPLTVELVDAVLDQCVPFLVSMARNAQPRAIGSDKQTYRNCYQACLKLIQARMRRAA